MGGVLPARRPLPRACCHDSPDRPDNGPHARLARDFEALNDTCGHADGDALLTRISQVLNESVPESDELARHGGEEFAVLATGTDLEGALFLAEKVQTAVAESSVEPAAGGEPLTVTVSIGVGEFAGGRERFFAAADRALYRAKGAGKNCGWGARRASTAESTQARGRLARAPALR